MPRGIDAVEEVEGVDGADDPAIAGRAPDPGEAWGR